MFAPADKRAALDTALVEGGKSGFQYQFDAWRLSDVVEGGQRKVTALELAAIADALQARMQSFFTDPAPSIVSHRSAQGLDATESAVDHLLTELAAAVEFLHGLPDLRHAGALLSRAGGYLAQQRGDALGMGDHALHRRACDLHHAGTAVDRLGVGAHGDDGPRRLQVLDRGEQCLAAPRRNR